MKTHLNQNESLLPEDNREDENDDDDWLNNIMKLSTDRLDDKLPVDQEKGLEDAPSFDQSDNFICS